MLRAGEQVQLTIALIGLMHLPGMVTGNESILCSVHETQRDLIVLQSVNGAHFRRPIAEPELADKISRIAEKRRKMEIFFQLSLNHILQVCEAAVYYSELYIGLFPQCQERKR